ncbi:MAG: ABC transporter permease [Egibacteraceae bacterium]
MTTLTVIGLVARREFTQRLRSKAFLAGNAFFLVLLIGVVVVPTLLGDSGPTRVGVVGEEAAALAAAAQARQAAFAVELRVEPVAERAAAEAALRDGTLDLVLLDAWTALAADTPSGPVAGLLAAAAQQLAVSEALAEAGVEAGRRAVLLAPRPLAVTILEGAGQPEFGPALAVGGAAVTVLYVLLIQYGQWVAQGIVEEKSSRVVEVLLAAVRPTELLAGKVLGLGALGLGQVLVTAAVGVGALLVVGSVEIPVEGWAAIGLVLAWYVLGYALYATLFAVCGAIAGRLEDLQSVVTPVIMLIVAGFFVAQYSAFNPDSTVARVAALVPFTAPLVQPLRAAAGLAAPWEIAASIVLAVAATGLLLPLAARFYTGGALRVARRIGLRAAWRAATHR